MRMSPIAPPTCAPTGRLPLFAPRLADWGGFHHQAIYIAEARRLGCVVRPPHVNHSEAQFTLATPGQGAAAGLFGWASARCAICARPPLLRSLPPEQKVILARWTTSSSAIAPQPRELTHLIQCGALDGLGANRAAMLATAGHVQSPSSQLSLGLFAATTEPDVAPETPSERLRWELHLLGMPVSVHPLETVALTSGSLPLAQAPASEGRTIQVDAVRLARLDRRAWFLLGRHLRFFDGYGAGEQPKAAGLGAAACGWALGA